MQVLRLLLLQQQRRGRRSQQRSDHCLIHCAICLELLQMPLSHLLGPAGQVCLINGLVTASTHDHKREHAAASPSHFAHALLVLCC